MDCMADCQPSSLVVPKIYFGGGFETANDANKATLSQLDQRSQIGLNIQVRARIICFQVI
jgi:hypothetical protein